ncbi:MAG: acyl carrier protein [Myxococcales bacterium]|nr:acyl carrier protein [Myxococcales bacterium]|tara:strand:- start:582 stop:812 length:231 start_codon:yes stop_codon:yes gene_type:complete
MSLDAKVTEIIAENLGVPAESVTPDKSFEELGADSLAVVELVMAFEDEFDIELDDGDAASLKTVQQTIDFVKNITA